LFQTYSKFRNTPAGGKENGDTLEKKPKPMEVRERCPGRITRQDLSETEVPLTADYMLNDSQDDTVRTIYFDKNRVTREDLSDTEVPSTEDCM
jgi:hypothetical protein